MTSTNFLTGFCFLPLFPLIFSLLFSSKEASIVTIPLEIFSFFLFLIQKKIDFVSTSTDFVASSSEQVRTLATNLNATELLDQAGKSALWIVDPGLLDDVAENEKGKEEEGVQKLLEVLFPFCFVFFLPWFDSHHPF